MEKKTTQEKEKYQPSYETTILTEVKCFRRVTLLQRVEREIWENMQSNWALETALQWRVCPDLIEIESGVKLKNDQVSKRCQSLLHFRV